MFTIIFEKIIGWITEKILDNLPSFLKRKKIDKNTAHILFVDDEQFPVVDNLKKAGWSVEKVKDLKNIDDDLVKRAHIIFVDYKGVGKNFSGKEEGIGLIKALVNKYNSAKRIILYSGHNRFTLEHDIKMAHNYLSKNSETYEFISMIESELKNIR